MKLPTNQLYGNVAEWNNIIIDLANSNFVKSAPMVDQIKDYRDSVQEEHKLKPKLYEYPDWNSSITVFDFEDLKEDALLVLCVRAQIGIPGHEHDQHRVYIWRGSQFDDEKAAQEIISPDDFAQKVMEQYWGCYNPEGQFNIQV